MKRTYDPTVARIAGNILSGVEFGDIRNESLLVESAVARARAIVAEVERTEERMCFCHHPESDHETIEYRGDKARSCNQCSGPARCVAFKSVR